MGIGTVTVNEWDPNKDLDPGFLQHMIDFKVIFGSVLVNNLRNQI